MIRSVAGVLVFASAAFAQVPPEKALATMKAGDGLQVSLFAAEPMLINPTNSDIDPLGRVWVTEAVNYRNHMRKKPLNRAEGDRIVILTDKDGDGKADESTVFYQGKELYGPLGICIIPFLTSPERKRGEDAKPVAHASGSLGFRVLVSQSPDILEFWDRDGDGKADGPPTKFLSGFGGYDHDHGVHSIQVGPDGKFYFTVGDQGFKDLKSRDGKQSFSQNRTTTQAGTVWRCDSDGNHLEMLAHNFRNPYEACVDSFGEIWLSDNDDDGNQQTRICHVMPGGNYGYWPRGKGESHWHEEQPGIVPKTLRTGFGSPCGITCYEGTLLPEKYRGALIHADAGPREIRAFHRKPKGAGYELDKTLMLTSTDNWFRPSDVCVAPDGSVFVCDWYDPGVGGHGMGDTTRGRVYRITPAGQTTKPTAVISVFTAANIVAILKSPNLATRSLLHASPEMAIAAARLPLFGEPNTPFNDPYVFERSMWCLPESPKKPIRSMVSSAIVGDKQFDERIQLQAVRILSQILSSENCRETSWKREDQSNKSSAMLREVLFYYASTTLQKSKPVFYDIAKLYDGQDRFYLAALNIACGTDPARRDAILVDFDKHFPEWNDKVAELVFELRPKCMMLKLPGLLSDGKLTPMQKARIVDILAASPEADAGKTMLTLLAADHQPEVKAKALANLRLFLPTKWKDLVKSQELGVTIDEFLNGPYQRPLGFELAAVAQDMSRVPVIAGYANRKDRLATERAAAIQALGQLRCEASMKVLADVMGARGDPLAPQAATALGLLITNTKPDAISQTSLESLQRKLQKNDNEPPELVNAILASLASSKLGTQWLLQQQEAKKLRPELAAEAGKLLRNSPFQGERNKALILFPAVAKLDLKTLPPPAELAKRTGDAKAGREVYLASFKGEAQCMKCHTVHKEGGAIGPDLSAIGKKASRENLFESILQPSKAVADQFVTWKIDSDDGSSATGLIVKETPTEIVLRDANGKDYTFAAKSMVKKKTPTSLMAEDVVKALTEQELIDLVEYLYSLKE